MEQGVLYAVRNTPLGHQIPIQILTMASKILHPRLLDRPLPHNAPRPSPPKMAPTLARLLAPPRRPPPPNGPNGRTPHPPRPSSPPKEIPGPLLHPHHGFRYLRPNIRRRKLVRRRRPHNRLRSDGDIQLLCFLRVRLRGAMLGERLKLSKAAAVGIAIVGVLIVAYGDQGTAKHGNKSGGGAGGKHAPADDEADHRLVGNLVIGVGSVLYGFYEVLYKRVACPPEGTSPGRGVIFANLFGSLIGIFTITVLWIPIPILHYLGWEIFEIPRGEAAWMLIISTLSNATFLGLLPRPYLPHKSSIEFRGSAFDDIFGRIVR